MTTTLIIGGVAGGMSTATRLRRLDEDMEIIVVEGSSHVSFANCGLPYHISETIEQRSSLLLQTPKSLHTRFNLDVRVNTLATKIDAKIKPSPSVILTVHKPHNTTTTWCFHPAGTRLSRRSQASNALTACAILKT